MRLPLSLLSLVLLMSLIAPATAKTGDVSEAEFRLIIAVGELRLHLPGTFTSYPRGPKPVHHTARRLAEPLAEDLLAAYADYLTLREEGKTHASNRILSQLHLDHDWDADLTDAQLDWLTDLTDTTAQLPDLFPTCPRTDDDCQEAQHTLLNDIKHFTSISNVLKQKHDGS